MFIFNPFRTVSWILAASVLIGLLSVNSSQAGKPSGSVSRPISLEWRPDPFKPPEIRLSSENGVSIATVNNNADLVRGGWATAKQLDWTGAAWVPGKDIVVYDWYTNPGMWQGYAGYRGLAIDRPGTSNQFEIIWMETPARSIEFQLTQNMGYAGAGQALATVTNYYLQGKNPGATVTVHDSQGNYPRALAGAKGKARWNDRLRRYEIVECNQMAIALACTLAYDMCSGTATGTLSGHIVLTFPPYGQAPNPLPTTARNYHHLARSNGSPVSATGTIPTGPRLPRFLSRPRMRSVTWPFPGCHAGWKWSTRGPSSRMAPSTSSLPGAFPTWSHGPPT